MRIGGCNRSYAARAKACAGVAAVVASFLIAAEASAHSVPGPEMPDWSETNSLAVQVQGVIRPRCALGSGGLVDMGDLTRSAEARVNIPLICNMPFVMRLNARNGAMVHSEMPGGQGGYSGHVPYGIEVAVPLIDPSPTGMGGRFSGSQLRAGVSLDSRDAIAAGGASFRFSSRGSEMDLLAGQYSETITVTIQPKM